MLEQQWWMDYAKDFVTEWKQMRDEGKQVDAFRELCTIIAEKAQDGKYEAMADEVYARMAEMPQTEGYPFVEPSALAEIRMCRPVKRHSFDCDLSEEQRKEKLTGAWIGRISGCLLGKPVEGMKTEQLHPLLKQTDNYPMHKYIMKKDFNDAVLESLGEWRERCWADTIEGIAPVDDDTNYTVFALKLVEKYGKEFRPNDVLEAWLSWIPMFETCTAERAAYRNAAAGKYAPDTAKYRNPYREWIGAQIRGDFFGYIYPGEPEKAAETAWRDGCISHVKNGIYGEMFVAAMIAAAAVCSDMKTVIEAGLDEIPEKSRLREAVEKVLLWHRQGLSAEDVMGEIRTQWDEHDSHDWCHTCSNAMIVVMALLYGENDFGKSICLAVQAGFDTDCNGATVGSVVGMMLGEKNIPLYWYACYEKRLRTGISGHNQVTVDQLAARTLRVIESPSQR